MTLTQQEIEMIEREAEKYAKKQDVECGEFVTRRSFVIQGKALVYNTYKDITTKYLLQLKEEREGAGKLVEAAELISHLHACEQEGLSSGQPTPAQWFDATNKLAEAINEYNNKP